MSQSFLHPSASITQLLDDETGRELDAREVLREDRTRVLRFKHRLQRSHVTGAGRILCAICGTPVYLAARPDKQAFVFRHFREDGSCPHITRGNMTAAQINACKYNGQRESARHIRLKNLVADSIKCDPYFSQPIVEGTWRGRDGDLRRPDVRSRFRDAIDVAFEIQLSTTFDSVMAEREEFYRKQGGLLLWVFGSFDPEHALLMNEIVFAVNNRNAYVVDDETLAASMAKRTLMLKCHWAQPQLGDTGIVWRSKVQMVSFDQLTLDQAGQRAYLVDTDSIEAGLKKKLEGPSLSEQLEDFWLNDEQFQGRVRPPLPEMDDQWHLLQTEFAKIGISLPARHDECFVSLLRALYSAKHGASVGWRYAKFWDAAHHVFDAEKGFIWIFHAALEAYGRLPGLEAQDKHHKWQAKVENWQASNAGENHNFDALIHEAFPDLAGHVQMQRGSGVEDWDVVPF